MISIHVPTRGTTGHCLEERKTTQFQSTCPRGARLSGFLPITTCTIFQSTCPRGARRCNRKNLQPCAISIHVPTRGTTMDPNKVRQTVIFQSTCPRGARLEFSKLFCRWFNFNPRAHEGHDVAADTKLYLYSHFNPRAHEGHDCFFLYRFCYFFISIHVPTRGTTKSTIT